MRRRQKPRGARGRHRTKDEVRLDSSLSNKLRWAKARKERAAYAAQRKPVKPPSDAPKGFAVRLADAGPDDCRWIAEEAEKHGAHSMICGAPVPEGSKFMFCDHHLRLAYVPIPRRDRGYIEWLAERA